MVSIFPPNYGLVPIFNVSYNTIIEIIEKGYSESFNNKCEKLLNLYKDSKGIDEDEIPFIKRLKTRCIGNNKVNEKKVHFDDELNRILNFLETVINNKTTYFSSYVKTGRRLKNINKDVYLKHKLSSISYTPFGVFDTRETSSFIKSSNHLYFDIDVKFNREDNKKLINFFINEPLVKASWLSFSGKGYAFVVECEWNTEFQMKKCYYKLLEYFTQELTKVGIEKMVFDTQVCNINRMNFISQNIIKRKTNYSKYKYIEYSDNLYNLLHETYKNTSLKQIPNRYLTEENGEEYFNSMKINKIDNKEKLVIRDEKMLYSFLNKITKNISFNGTNDYNTAIKDYINRVFIYQIDASTLEDFLFERIPHTNKTSRKFDEIWKNYSRYNSFYTQEPCIYI